ncbi:cysteinyl-tRNA synthetase [Desulfofundulus kuznetsovii DSM 6115]|uniref:Cysteine--tRNA ligase n=1 Tax=Desulfofundulus kuznetsovii (strain DSM 6115 / VKM B-1805 / 17) TaxID=760568 RepID=A0AAU8PEU7_DESK7|nr:cysteinyl-tRNA synthetase [Desulfofundulus kuznetsovii DSM 6115]
MEIYNTLTRRKEKFIPRHPGRVDMYVCGPTTYNFIHLGNARPLVFFDTVRRYFQYRGYRVKYVQNFTDIDDKIINRAREEGVDALALARKYIDEYYRDAEALNVRPADVHPRVSEHLPEIIDLISTLIEKKAAYVVDGDVYFDISAFPEYGKLSGRTLEEMQAGARVEVDPRKKHPMDFALWKAAKPGEPAWDSPWGKGRPGWHIECSAMALKYLGNNFDIHGGGFDLVFPHHENEIAQAEAATGRPFVRYWMHNGFITVNQEKMSKSLGNFFLVREILDRFPPEVVRFFLLSTHYRSPLDFDDEKMAAAGRGLERFKNSIRLLTEALDRPSREQIEPEDEEFIAALEKHHRDFVAAMDDDFNTALAVGIWFELAREVNAYLHGTAGSPCRAALEKAMDLFRSFNEVLGLFRVDERTGRILIEGRHAKSDGLEEALIELLLEVRQQARAKKDWATADRIRDRLKELGIILEDTPGGVRWKRQG